MSNSDSKSKDNERRNFFRLHNSVLIEYRKAEQYEVDQFLSDGSNIKSDELDVTYQLDQLSRQLSPLLISVRQESSATAQYLELLNQKVDVLASMLSFEKFRFESGDKSLASAETLDLSEGGMSFLSKEAFQPGNFLYCKLAIVGYRLGMETFAKVTTCDKTDVSSFRIGVEFPYLRELDKKNLTRYIFDKQRELLRQRSDSE